MPRRRGKQSRAPHAMGGVRLRYVGSRFPAHSEGSEADNPVVWRPGCHPPADEESTPLGRLIMRLQIPLPDAYTLAPPDELEQRIRIAKETLGDRLLILGHHYQRDEVIRWADSTGDS